MAQHTISECCLKGFQWEGTPKGKESKLAGLSAYVTGPEDSDAAILVIHDLFGWTFTNLRLLADYYAESVGARVWVPDFFDGWVPDAKAILSGDWSSLDIPTFKVRNSKENRRDEIFACARALRAAHRRVGAVGFCYGGWAVMQLGAKSSGGLVDCVSMAHPSWVTHEEIDGLGVPVQIQAPERDNQLTPELKEYANRVIPTLNIPYEYVYFPGTEHGFATRGESIDKWSQQSMRRSMMSAAAWFTVWLKADGGEK